MIAAVGPLSWDVVDGGARRPGGPVYYAARALRHLDAAARIGASCALVDREELAPVLESFGFPVAWRDSEQTTAYRMRYARSGRRLMHQEAVGTPWPPEEAVAAAGDAAWVHVGALVRTDFPQSTLSALAEGRTLLLDGQGLVRTPTLGPLRSDGRFRRDLLRHVAILKLDEEEARIAVGDLEPGHLQALGVPEVLVTLAGKGVIVVTPHGVEPVPAAEVEGRIDPTGAGDMFSAGYLRARSQGGEPVEAARFATNTAAALLAG